MSKNLQIHYIIPRSLHCRTRNACPFARWHIVYEDVNAYNNIKKSLGARVLFTVRFSFPFFLSFFIIIIIIIILILPRDAF